MFDLIQVGTHTWYIECPARMGIYRTDETHAILIDAGNDDQDAEQILDHFVRQGWTLSALLNTHAHADHIGGNRAILDRTGCTAFAPEIEAAFTHDVLLEPALLYGGAPPRQIWGNFLYAAPSHARPLSEYTFPAGLSATPLPGHSQDMYGYCTDDGVWFLGDCLVSEKILEKVGITYVYNIVQYLQTLDRVEQLQGNLFIPSHAKPVEQIGPLVRQNRAKVYEITERIRNFCDGAETDEITRRVFRHYNLHMSLSQYALIGSTVRAYLSMLLDRGDIAFELDDYRVLWRKV